MLAGRRCAQRAMCCNLSWSCRPLSSGENRSFWASQRAANTSQRIGPAFVFHPRIPRTCHSFHYSRPFPYRADPSLDIDRYHKVSDTTLDALVESLEAIFEDPQYVPEPFDDGPEVEYSSGVMTIRMGGGRGTYVINKQPPNQQIWLSSPISGPKRYDYDSEHSVWFYARDGSVMEDLLNSELSGFLNKKIDLDFGKDSL